MPLDINDDETSALVAALAALRVGSKQAAVRHAVKAELDRVGQATPLRDRFAALRRAFPLPEPTGKARGQGLPR
jgi:antitoxin VapB